MGLCQPPQKSFHVPHPNPSSSRPLRAGPGIFLGPSRQSCPHTEHSLPARMLLAVLPADHLMGPSQQASAFCTITPFREANMNFRQERALSKVTWCGSRTVTPVCLTPSPVLPSSTLPGATAPS